MQETFSRAFGADRAQLAQEDQLAEQLRPDGSAIAQMESDAAAGLKTMVVDLAKEGLMSLSEAPYGEGEESLETTAEMTIQEALSLAKIQQGEEEEDGDDVVTQEKKISDIMARIHEDSVTDRSPLGESEDDSTVQDSMEKRPPPDQSKFVAKTRAEPAAAQQRRDDPPPRKPPEPGSDVPPPLPSDRAITLETLVNPQARPTVPPQAPAAPKAPSRVGLPPGTPVRTTSPHIPDRIDQAAAQEPEKERSVLFYVVFVLLGLALGMGLFSLYLALSN
jgi:hypothetical protein